MQKYVLMTTFVDETLNTFLSWGEITPKGGWNQPDLINGIECGIYFNHFTYFYPIDNHEYREHSKQSLTWHLNDGQ